MIAKEMQNDRHKKTTIRIASNSRFEMKFSWQLSLFFRNNVFYIQFRRCKNLNYTI
jgi:hypothetical protein